MNTQKIQSLMKVLINTYGLYLKSQVYHWNVTGMRFQGLHALFEAHYKDLAEAVDDIAERIRVFEHRVDLDFEILQQKTTLPPILKTMADVDMIKDLIESHLALIALLKDTCQLASEEGDEVTADLMIARLHRHEKNLWILKSHIQ